jgi:alkanesulfonate monooxygenase SsuD/methylene tetrahydromethanopterin reductase-like flavin-dependent oxidoreductase (luciferase family)
MKTVNGLNRIAVTTPVWGASADELRSMAYEAESAGFDAIFSPEVPPYSAISNAQIFAEATTRINVGTWITSIYMRQPVMCAAETITVQEISGGRMILGLGVSHRSVVTDRFGIDRGDLIEDMRKYVTSVRTFIKGESELLTVKRLVPDIPIYIAALTEKAACLAGEIADGLMLFMASPEYVKEIRRVIDEAALKAGRKPSEVDITHGIPAFISDDLDSAYESARRGLSAYAGRFPVYQRVIRKIGFGGMIEKINAGENPATALTNEFLDSVALIGSPGRCRDRLEHFRAAGVELPIIAPNPVGQQSSIDVIKNTFRTFPV